VKEEFRPIPNAPPNTFWNRLKFQVRLLIDFQVKTVYDDLKKSLPKTKGKVLDVGGGQGPYKHLLNTQMTRYYGLEINTAIRFG
jgi:hypothetical protein